MAENLEALPERVDTIERKLDTLSASVDKRFDDVNRRFDDVDKRFEEVSEHFVEQRKYTEFAFERLEKSMGDGFTSVRTDIERLERKLDQFVEGQSGTV